MKFFEELNEKLNTEKFGAPEQVRVVNLIRDSLILKSKISGEREIAIASISFVNNVLSLLHVIWLEKFMSNDDECESNQHILLTLDDPDELMEIFFEDKILLSKMSQAGVIAASDFLAIPYRYEISYRLKDIQHLMSSPIYSPVHAYVGKLLNNSSELRELLINEFYQNNDPILRGHVPKIVKNTQ